MWKQFIKDYLNFSRKERTAVLLLLTVILMVAILPLLVPSRKWKPDKKVMETLQKQMALLKQRDAAYHDRPAKEINPGANNYPAKRTANASKRELFYFNPNTLSAEAWKRLGLRDKTIQTIQNYLSKGGRFRKPEDLGRVYGLFKDEYEILRPYVKMDAQKKSEEKEYSGKEYTKHNSFTKKTLPLNAIDISMADSNALIALPGIGNKLAARIINFRDKLGGFYAVAQVAETYGLPDSTFQKIQTHLFCSGTGIHQLNINTADANTLKQHPYIRWNIANAIVQYRKQHGNFKTVDELQQLSIITAEMFQKVRPYLVVE